MLTYDLELKDLAKDVGNHCVQNTKYGSIFDIPQCSAIMKAYGDRRAAEARNSALEEAARQCDDDDTKIGDRLAKDIRAMKKG